MLLVTADVFSGRQNPGWTVTDDQEVKTLLEEIAQNRDFISVDASASAGLGFRGVFVEPLSDDLTQDFDLPPTIYLPLDKDESNTKNVEIVERLVSRITQSTPPVDAGPQALPLDESLQSFLMQQLRLSNRMMVLDSAMNDAIPESAAELADAVCYYDLTPYNPNFWNSDPNVRSRNNCYNYASNKRTNTFAQPGRGCGHMYTAITCAEVTRGALCDRLHRRYDCFPDSEYPRHLVALVIAPGWDFHWYRKHRGGFWAHKPGGTAAKDVDNSGNRIWNPETCDRGPYTQFCGYFYTCRSSTIR